MKVEYQPDAGRHAEEVVQLGQHLGSAGVGLPPQLVLRLKASGKGSGAALEHLEQRLDRLEQLVLLIAKQVGDPPEAIAQLAAPAALAPADDSQAGSHWASLIASC